MAYFCKLTLSTATVQMIYSRLKGEDSWRPGQTILLSLHPQKITEAKKTNIFKYRSYLETNWGSMNHCGASTGSLTLDPLQLVWSCTNTVIFLSNICRMGSTCSDIWADGYDATQAPFPVTQVRWFKIHKILVTGLRPETKQLSAVWMFPENTPLVNFKHLLRAESSWWRLSLAKLGI